MAGMKIRYDIKVTGNAPKKLNALTTAATNAARVIKSLITDITGLTKATNALNTSLRSTNTATRKLNSNAKNLNKTYEKAIKNAKDLNSAQKSLSANSRGLGSSLGQLFSKITGVQVGIAGIAVAFGSLGSSMVDATAQTQSITVQFESLLRSKSKADALVKDIVQFTATTPFKEKEVASAARSMEIFGKGALSGLKNLRRFSDVAAVTGKRIDVVAFNLSRLYDGLQSGTAIGRAMLSLQRFGAVTGNVRREVEALHKKGLKVEAWQAVTDEIDRFSGATEKLSQTTAGLSSTLSDTWDLVFKKIDKSLGISKQLNILQRAMIREGREFAGVTDTRAKAESEQDLEKRLNIAKSAAKVQEEAIKRQKEAAKGSGFTQHREEQKLIAQKKELYATELLIFDTEQKLQVQRNKAFSRAPKKEKFVDTSLADAQAKLAGKLERRGATFNLTGLAKQKAARIAAAKDFYKTLIDFADKNSLSVISIEKQHKAELLSIDNEFTEKQQKLDDAAAAKQKAKDAKEKKATEKAAKEKATAILSAQNRLELSKKEGFDRELLALDQKHAAELERIKIHGEAVTALTAAQKNERNELIKEHDKKEKAELTAKVISRMQGEAAVYQNATENALGLAKTLTSIKQVQLDNEIKLMRKKGMSESKIQKETEKKRREIFQAEKRANIATAIINGAAGAITAYATAAQLGPVAGPIVGGINAALVGAMTVAQVAMISQQKFAAGGIVNSNKRSGDNNMVAVNGGEMILNARQQASLSGLITGSETLNSNKQSDILRRLDNNQSFGNSTSNVTNVTVHYTGLPQDFDAIVLQANRNNDENLNSGDR